MSESVKQDEKKTETNADMNKDVPESNVKDADETKKEHKGKNALKEAEKKIADLEKENAELKDQILRRAADFDNYRKRMIREKQEAYDYANENLLQDLLSSVDDFDRALEAGKTATDVKSIAEGVGIINKQLVNMLETKYDLTSYGAAGDIFNPDEHEAIASEQGHVDEPVLKAVYLKGYKLKGKVIRHAKVMVVMPDGCAKDEESKEQEENK